MNTVDRIDIVYPWTISVFQNVFDTDMLSKYTKEFDSINWHDIHQKESYWDQVYEHELFDIVAENFESVPDKMLYKFDTPDNTLQVPHQDNYYKTLQIFLSVDNNALGGTVLHDTGPPKMSYELPLLSNSMTYFKNTEGSWHSVNQQNLTRKSIIFRWNNQKS